MNNLQEENLNLDNNTEDTIEFEVDTNNFVYSLLSNVIGAYQEAYNKNSDKYEVKFNTTLTNHKIQTPDGNKAVAYLRLERSVREKGVPKLIPNPEEGKPDIIDEGWETKIVHQEVYFFKSLKEQVDPRALWKDQLYMNCLARLISAGLEYAELLQRLKPTMEHMRNEAKPKEEQTTEERLSNIGLTAETTMPTPPTKQEQEYKEWIKQNNVYGKG